MTWAWTSIAGVRDRFALGEVSVILAPALVAARRRLPPDTSVSYPGPRLWSEKTCRASRRAPIGEERRRMSDLKLATYQGAQGARAGIIAGDTIFDVAESTAVRPMRRCSTCCATGTQRAASFGTPPSRRPAGAADVR